ncbi:hypothetical protein [Paraburkholderia haematera]|uniref:DUF885 domain-containing protein n=1 Tax=Paraburkholderia haematera TaxID=2793077 RepID=A0ABM8RCF2_9BURK|nr:hypothetical protein [Paraburkholderia haematera]CAE6745345.1 hypothetical protein R69888_02703 [Paraburkholderia haematera]
MKLATRFLLTAIVVICAVTAFFHGRDLAPKQDVKETSVRAARVSDATVWINPFSKTSPAYREAEEFHQWLLDKRKLADEVGAVGPVDKLLRSGQMVNSGMARLPTNLLEQRLSSVNKILASLDTHMCSKYIKGKMPESEFQSYAFPVMESFDDAEAKAWFFANRSALEAELDRAPIIVVSTEEVLQGLQKIEQSIYQPQSRAFVSGLANLNSESDEDACATARTLYVKGKSLPEPYRGYMARLLLTMDNGRQKL